jgi:non-homologous end joining protein Ku
MAASTWRGAIEIAGFSVNLALYNRVKSRSSESFKTLAPNGKPIRKVSIDSDEYAKLEKDPKAKVATLGKADESKGVAVGPDDWKPLSKEAVEQIQGAERSTVVTPDAFVPADSLPRELATTAFVVVPDNKVPGSEGDVNLVWNGLRASGLAYTTTVVTRAGSRDSILAIYAEDDGLYGVALPFDTELNDVPAFGFTEDASAGEVFTAAVEANHEVAQAFNHSAYVSEWRTRRDDAVAKVLKGQKIEPPKPKAAPTTDSLRAALEKAVDAKDAPKSKAKKPASKSGGRKKVAA